MSLEAKMSLTATCNLEVVSPEQLEAERLEEERARLAEKSEALREDGGPNEA